MRLAGGAAILAVLVARVGTGPFVDAVRLTNAGALLVAAAVTAVTTVACAWRWRLVARGLGVDVPLPAAVGAYYRSQFLNCTLPGGVLGDVHRAVAHGRDAGDIGRSVRAVGWERSAGPGRPGRAHRGRAAAAAVAGALVAAGHRGRRRWRSRWSSLLVGFVVRGTRGLPARIVRAVVRRRTPRPAGPTPVARHPARLHGRRRRPPRGLPGRGADRRRARVGGRASCRSR